MYTVNYIYTYYLIIYRYISQGLAKLVNDNPRTIRLNFPADLKNRKDNFSVLPRENICSVCGRSKHFRKKSIIPKEFVRHMPSMYCILILF